MITFSEHDEIAVNLFSNAASLLHTAQVSKFIRTGVKLCSQRFNVFHSETEYFNTPGTRFPKFALFTAISFLTRQLVLVFIGGRGKKRKNEEKGTEEKFDTIYTIS